MMLKSQLFIKRLGILLTGNERSEKYKKMALSQQTAAAEDLLGSGRHLASDACCPTHTSETHSLHFYSLMDTTPSRSKQFARSP